MEKLRKPAQGVLNIIRFNWHFFAFSLVNVTILLCFPNQYCYILCVLILISTILSLAVSYYIYDFSGLYNLKWLYDFELNDNSKIINIHAGFDETSELLAQHFPNSELLIYDFYDEMKHTEISIKRARNRYPNHIKTQKIETSFLPNQNESINLIFLIFAAHEIRTQDERDAFFKEMNRVLAPNGKLILVEHFRDFPNFLAYNIGFFHFLPKKTWLTTFKDSNFLIEKKIKFTFFVNIYKLHKNANN